MRPLIVLVTMGIGQAIVWSSALSFLGLGAQPPAAEWGTMLAMGHRLRAGAGCQHGIHWSILRRQGKVKKGIRCDEIRVI
jgi:ABC-type dipeptide/oligopeptide/nickel transport system permease subunit